MLRRWGAALMAVPGPEREALVEEVERRVAQAYSAPTDAPATHATEERLLNLVAPPRVVDDHTEQVVRTFAVLPEPRQRAVPKRRTRRGG